MKNKDFYKQMKIQEQEKRAVGDESTADLYRAVRNHFMNFNDNQELLMKDVTPQMIHAFLKWLQEKGLRVNTVNSYLSNLRAMYNRASFGWKSRPLESPFAGIHLKREETMKRAVPVEVIKKLALLDLKDEPDKQLAVDMGLFSFLACGIPFVDIVHLTRDNLEDNGKVLSYHRQKTGIQVRMEVNQGMQLLIDRYSRPGAYYLFPLLPENATHEQYKYCLAVENLYLKQVCIDFGLLDILTTYVFRHAWASEAYHQGVPISIISQALGHTSEKTTRIYLAAFSLDKMAEATHIVIKHVEAAMSA
ncbi:MAG: tyrosine-type recombinase/integrase [Parabacteroides gordonii]|uniref:tyrosine-type recombinase/integrase n=1 Tax=Parabacteroides gordonii TaxID=574930 RepID=UPI003A8368AF